MPTYQDLAIFVPTTMTTDRQTDYFTPCACAQVNINQHKVIGRKFNTALSAFWLQIVACYLKLSNPHSRLTWFILYTRNYKSVWVRMVDNCTGLIGQSCDQSQIKLDHYPKLHFFSQIVFINVRAHLKLSLHKKKKKKYNFLVFIGKCLDLNVHSLE